MSWKLVPYFRWDIWYKCYILLLLWFCNCRKPLGNNSKEANYWSQSWLETRRVCSPSSYRNEESKYNQTCFTVYDNRWYLFWFSNRPQSAGFWMKLFRSFLFQSGWLIQPLCSDHFSNWKKKPWCLSSLRLNNLAGLTSLLGVMKVDLSSQALGMAFPSVGTIVGMNSGNK